MGRGEGERDVRSGQGTEEAGAAVAARVDERREDGVEDDDELEDDGDEGVLAASADDTLNDERMD